MKVNYANNSSLVREIAQKGQETLKESPIRAIKETTADYVKVIKDFFSSDGAGEHIKEMYIKIKPSFEKLPQLNIQDLNYAHHMYTEYINGMKEFLKNELNQIDGTSTDSEMNKLCEYMQKDNMFITSLFGNGSNVKTSTNISLEEGLTNLEVFIDFIPELEKYSVFAESLKELIIDGGYDTDEVSKKLLQLYCKSIITYSEYLIISLFDCFQVMVDSIWAKKTYPMQDKVNPIPAVKADLVLL